MQELADNDWRKAHPNFTGAKLARNVALADALRPIANKYGSSAGAVAVAWTLAVPGVAPRPSSGPAGPLKLTT